MDFNFTEEQLMIKDTARSFLQEVSSSEKIREAMTTSTGYAVKTWERICQEMYWQGIHIPEEYGGLGLSFVELACVFEESGRHLLCSPFFATAGLATNALIVGGSTEQKEKYLPLFAAGECTGTVAYTGNNGHWDEQGVQATYTRKGDQFVLDGELRYVPDGHHADLLVVAAREQGSYGKQGISLFLVDTHTSGIKKTALPTMDQTRPQAAIVLNHVEVKAENILGEVGNGWPLLSVIIQLATIATAAEQLGGMEQTMDMAVSYTKGRSQFNRPVASFQSIKHKAADMMTRTEVARSAVYYSACIAAETIAAGKFDNSLAEAASIAKAWCSDGYFSNSSDCLQLHGGVGFSWEYDVHLYLKRAKSSETFLGNSAWHRDRVADMILGSNLKEEIH
tara:strand:+ start:159 stop:1340 length:1182 start_codon:yes stop_codon:yes gene_type:complete